MEGSTAPLVPSSPPSTCATQTYHWISFIPSSIHLFIPSSLDSFIHAGIARRVPRVFRMEDLEIGQVLGQGFYGCVYMVRVHALI